MLAMPTSPAASSMPSDADEAEADTAEGVLVHSPVLDTLESYFCDPAVTGAINDFACLHAPSITPLAEGAEHPLAYHAAFMEYTKLIEEKVAAFMAEHSVTENDILVASLHAPPGVHTCIDYLLASTEYTAFLQLMADFNSLSDYEVTDALE